MRVTTRRRWLGGGTLLFLGLLAGAPRAGAPATSESRRSAIRRSIEALHHECQTYGGGDWGRWYDRLGAFRADLRTRIAAGSKGWGTPNYLIELSGRPLLFERSDEISHLAEDGNLDSWMSKREVIPTVIHVKQWLEKQGIDLIFVSVPRVLQVYPDRVSTNVPADMIIAPQIKKLELGLLTNDVEAIDMLPRVLAARRDSPEPLMLSGDPHWGPRAENIAADLIAERLARYPFVQKATAGPLLYHDERITHAITADWHPWLKLLTPEQLQRRAASEPDVTGPHVLDVHNKPFQPAKSSSVVLMGDSFCTALNYLLGPGAGLDAEISRRINMPVALWQVDGGTVQTIKDVARDPEMLKGVKVIVWVMQDQSVCNPTAWRLPPLPPPATSATGARGRS